MVLLSVIRKNPKIREILNIEAIEYLDADSLYEWYINRRHQNFFIDLNKYPDRIKDSDLDTLLNDQMSLSERFYTDTDFLPLAGSLKLMKSQKIAKDVIIYHPHDNTFAKKDLEDKLHESFIWCTSFADAMKKAGYNSTYFLSDIRHIEEMRQAGVLTMSSVTIPSEYRYNKKSMTEFNLDYKKLMEDTPFKLSYIEACKYEEGQGG